MDRSLPVRLAAFSEERHGIKHSSEWSSAGESSLILKLFADLLHDSLLMQKVKKRKALICITKGFLTLMTRKDTRR